MSEAPASSLLGRLHVPAGAVPFLIAALLWAALCAMSFLSQWRLIELKGFDVLTVVSAPGRSALPIAIVGIDEPSFAELERQWPWPRSWHGKLIDALHRSGAAVIALDLIFSEPSPQPEEDQAFADAIARAGNVVLAADITFRETAQTREWLRADPVSILRKAGGATGLATVTLDGDLVIRRVPTTHDAFWRVIIDKLREANPGMIPEVSLVPNAMIRYLGPDHTFPYVSYYQALDPEQFLPKDALKDHIILVGRDVKASPEPGMALADMMATPFLPFSNLLTPGVELHATLIENAIRRQMISELPRAADLALLALGIALATWWMRAWRPLASALVGLGVMGAMAALAYALFAYANLWLAAIAPMAGVVLAYVSRGGVAFLGEQRRRNELKRAFAHYVSPHVVEELAAHPEKLRLGGERRELTIMFTDLAGFTTISEELPPEQVANILNRHLTDMTRIVLKHGGTVDKFIGDAVMAFWGAPLEDSRHAKHACQAAIEMQQAMDRMQAALLAEGGPDVYMRIGVTTGPVIVGNMGAEDRFDYTVIGDTTNLAARLEGVNKIYGTKILVTQSTVDHAGEGFVFRPVDKVSVKGKAQAVELYTPHAEQKILARTREAIDAYREQRWDDSIRLWRGILADYPGDPLAGYYLLRIAELRLAELPPDWDGSLVLTTK